MSNNSQRDCLLQMTITRTSVTNSDNYLGAKKEQGKMPGME